MADDREARIRDRAYHLWVERGRPVGRDEEHWHEATRQIDQDEETGVEMMQEHGDDSIAKPKRGSVIKDKRRAEPPANQSDEPAPVHAEQEPLQGDKKTKGKAKRAAEPASAAVEAPLPKARKGKVKSGSIEAI